MKRVVAVYYTSVNCNLLTLLLRFFCGFLIEVIPTVVREISTDIARRADRLQ